MDQDMMMTEADSQDSAQSMILNAFSSSVDPEEILNMLSDYEEQFGVDTFWKMTSFDTAELMKDTDRMETILDLFEEGEISPVLSSINHARIYYIKEEFQKALDKLNQVEGLDDSEESLMYLHIKGICSFAVKDYGTAAQCMEDVLMDFNDSQMFAFAAVSYLHLGEQDRAREYFTKLEENFKDSDVDWLYDLLRHFQEIPVVWEKEFPDSIYRRLKTEVDKELSENIFTLEEMVLEDPNGYSALIAERLKQEPDSHINNYLMGILAESKGDTDLARWSFRKALTTPCSITNNHFIRTSQLEARLFSLDKLNYARQTKQKHLMKMSEELKDCDSCQIDLMAYCALEDQHGTLKKIMEAGAPFHPYCSGEQYKLDLASITYYMDQKDYAEAYRIGKAQYTHHASDLYFILACGFLFTLFDPKFKPEYQTEEEYDDFPRYLQDQILRCEIGRYRHTKAFAATLMRLLESMKRDLQGSKEPHDWTVFLQYVYRVAEEIEAHPRLGDFFVILNSIL